jgi:hypothetical protein
MDSEFTPEFFTASSQAWMLNKKKRANATYVYICRLCTSEVFPESDLCQFHERERMKNENPPITPTNQGYQTRSKTRAANNGTA